MNVARFVCALTLLMIIGCDSKKADEALRKRAEADRAAAAVMFAEAKAQVDLSAPPAASGRRRATRPSRDVEDVEKEVGVVDAAASR